MSDDEPMITEISLTLSLIAEETKQYPALSVCPVFIPSTLLSRNKSLFLLGCFILLKVYCFLANLAYNKGNSRIKALDKTATSRALTYVSGSG